jgi:hypothetical protein
MAWRSLMMGVAAARQVLMWLTDIAASYGFIIASMRAE